MAVADIITGENAKVEIGTAIVLTNSSWSLRRMTNPVDVSNTRDGRARKKSLGDYTGSVEGVFDPTVNPHVSIEADAEMPIKLYIDATRFYSLVVIFDNIDVKSNGQEAAFTWSFDFMLANGTVTTPVLS